MELTHVYHFMNMNLVYTDNYNM